MRDYESVWQALEEWRERTAGDVAIESVGAGWLCRLKSPDRGIATALCHGADATTAVEGALAVLSARARQPVPAEPAPHREPSHFLPEALRLPEDEPSPQSRVTTRTSSAPPPAGPEENAALPSRAFIWSPHDGTR